ncbi:WD-40 repeat protein [Grimontia indica]|uniref:WD-40 repeat protein n=1 Tax=Grimontia indica TaxID=1056512 RepID=R1IDQ8_9GAMM|nr:WD40 repeat domain-containing protein [Grimontia indica]EOD78876.1 WD-40 repeat protein [Grimontia indica]
MQDKIALSALGGSSLGHEAEETYLESRGISLKMGASVTGAVSFGQGVAAGFGSGEIAFFGFDDEPVLVQAHESVVLCLTTDGESVLSGGDDGRFLRVTPDGNIVEIATFGTKWVDCVGAAQGLFACSSGRTVYLWFDEKSSPILLEHPSTVGGIAFDERSKQMAVTHYGGVTLWEQKNGQWTSLLLPWKGVHGAVDFSPDGRFLITLMQENAVHIWRLTDGADLEMSGYPKKVKSYSWMGETPYLATSGADEVICWPFDGKDGPLRRAPVCIGRRGEQVVTCVRAFSSDSAVLAGYRDGAVFLCELDESDEAVILRRPTGAEVTVIALTCSCSHMLIGDAAGCVVWASL